MEFKVLPFPFNTIKPLLRKDYYSSKNIPMGWKTGGKIPGVRMRWGELFDNRKKSITLPKMPVNL